MERQELLHLLKQYSYEKRKVTLSSGRESDFYIDCKSVTLSKRGSQLIGHLFNRLIDPDVRFVGGLTLGADPIAHAILRNHDRTKDHVEGVFIVRKEPKRHGTEQFLEVPGNMFKTVEVAIVEDVITTGASTIRAIERVRAEGYNVIQVLALIDREEDDGLLNVQKLVTRTNALFCRKDFEDAGTVDQPTPQHAGSSEPVLPTAVQDSGTGAVDGTGSAGRPPGSNGRPVGNRRRKSTQTSRAG